MTSFGLNGKRLGRPSTGLTVKWSVTMTPDDARAIEVIAREMDVPARVAARGLIRLGLAAIKEGTHLVLRSDRPNSV